MSEGTDKVAAKGMIEIGAVNSRKIKKEDGVLPLCSRRMSADEGACKVTVKILRFVSVVVGFQCREKETFPEATGARPEFRSRRGR